MIRVLKKKVNHDLYLRPEVVLYCFSYLIVIDWLVNLASTAISHLWDHILHLHVYRCFCLNLTLLI